MPIKKLTLLMAFAVAATGVYADSLFGTKSTDTAEQRRTKMVAWLEKTPSPTAFLREVGKAKGEGVTEADALAVLEQVLLNMRRAGTIDRRREVVWAYQDLSGPEAVASLRRVLDFSIATPRDYAITVLADKIAPAQVQELEPLLKRTEGSRSTVFYRLRKRYLKLQTDDPKAAKQIQAFLVSQGFFDPKVGGYEQTDTALETAHEVLELDAHLRYAEAALKSAVAEIEAAGGKIELTGKTEFHPKGGYSSRSVGKLALGNAPLAAEIPPLADISTVDPAAVKTLVSEVEQAAADAKTRPNAIAPLTVLSRLRSPGLAKTMDQILLQVPMVDQGPADGQFRLLAAATLVRNSDRPGNVMALFLSVFTAPERGRLYRVLAQAFLEGAEPTRESVRKFVTKHVPARSNRDFAMADPIFAAAIPSYRLSMERLNLLLELAEINPHRIKQGILALASSNCRDLIDVKVLLGTAVKPEIEIAGIGFVPIPAGRVQLALPPDLRKPTERSVDRFWISQYEVTQEQFEAMLKHNPSRTRIVNGKATATGDKGETAAKYPVENVSWDDAVSFAKQLTTLAEKEKLLPAGTVVRLPTLAEWTYACRAGSDATTEFFFGDPGKISQFAWIGKDAATRPVGSLKPNPWGLYDILGNVAEWCLDPWRTKGATREERKTVYRSIAGHANLSVANDVAYAQLGRWAVANPDKTHPRLGFRLVIARPATTPETTFHPNKWKAAP